MAYQYLSKQDQDRFEIVLRELNKHNPVSEKLKEELSQREEIYEGFIKENSHNLLKSLLALKLSGIDVKEALILTFSMAELLLHDVTAKAEAESKKKGGE